MPSRVQSSGCLLIGIAVALAMHSSTQAADAVYLKPNTPGGPLVRVRGEIVDYNGRELRMQNGAGRERAIPAANVERIEFTRSPEHMAGDEQFAAGDFQRAISSYQRALQGTREPRDWVRRQIVARLIWCLRNLGQWDEAGKYFLTLVASDPATPDFQAIPLLWQDEPLRPEVAQQAQAWLADAPEPAATLIGASLLLNSEARPQALAKLRTLLADPDPRIVWLAYAQLFRAGANNATLDQQRSFAARIEASDASLRAGPYFVLGQSRLGQRPTDAILALLHVPILFEEERSLAAAALVAAAQVLAGQGEPDQALSLYREAQGKYGETAAGNTAAAHVARLAPDAGNVEVNPPTGNYLEGLRGRRLYTLAERYCEDRLSDSELTDRARADLVVELSRTLAEHALVAPPGDALALWQRAVEVTRSFIEKHPTSPRLILVQLQGALVRLAEGETARYQAHEDFASPAMEDARRVLRDAIDALEETAAAVATGLRLQDASKMTDDDLSTAELQSLELNVHLELARGLRNQAECYAPGSADRINSLTRAGEALATLSRHKTRNLLYWRGALEQLARLRLLGDPMQAEQQLKAHESESPPAAIQQQLRAERIRLALSRGQIDDALAEAGPAADKVPSPELDYARLEAFIEAYRRASGRHDQEEAAEWQRRAVEQARMIRQTFGGSWMRRADSLLASSVAGSGGPQSYATLAFSAAGYYRGGELDKALKAFDEAARQALAEQQPAKAFDAAYAGATIEKERGHFAEARDRYERLATESPEMPQAPAAHLMAAYCAGQVAQSQKPPQMDEYARLLREHVQRWPGGKTASQAYSWLGRLAEHDRQWTEAIALLSQVKPSDPQYGGAIEAIGRCYEALLNETRERGGDERKLANEALGVLERATESATKHGAKPDNATRAATLAAARIWLTAMPGGALPAERLLRGSLEADTQAPAAWRQQASRWLVPALVLEGKGGQADQLIEQLPTNTRDQLALLETIATVRRNQTPEGQAKLAQLELALQTRLLEQPGDLDGSVLRAVRRGQALTLAETGQRQQGLEILQQLVREFPRDGQTYEDLAALLAGGSRVEQESAAQMWTDVVRKSRPGTARWFRAHLGLARTQLKLGQTAEARATIQHVTAKYPSLDGELKSQFDALSAEAARGG